MGVRRAVDAVEQALLDNPRRPVYTCGPLIHNPDALAHLAAEGVVILDENIDTFPLDFAGASVVIRAHGIPPSERDELVRRHAHVVDASCPRVLSSQKRACVYYKKGIPVYLAGDRNHGEITAIAGYVPGCIILQNSEDAKNQTEYPDKAVLISQTTIKQAEYSAIAEVLSQHIHDLTVLNTICPATMERQKALEQLARLVDGIIVIGGKNSANTQRLFHTALLLTGKAWHIENLKDIPSEVYSLEKIGITAGASTPDEIIDAVEQALQKV